MSLDTGGPLHIQSSLAESAAGGTGPLDHAGYRAARPYLPSCGRFSSQLYLRTLGQIWGIGGADMLVLALGMMVNSPIIGRLPASVLWPFAPLMANRVLEILCIHLGFVTPLFSVVQLPLSVMALGVYIRVSHCSPWTKPPQAIPPQPFCSAPIVLAATVVLIEVMIFLMVLYITQTFRHERFLEIAHQMSAADPEQARSSCGMDVSEGYLESAKPYVLVKQPGQEYMIARVLDPPQKLLPRSPLVGQLHSTHIGTSRACQTSEVASEIHETLAEPHHDERASHHGTESTRLESFLSQPHAALTERIISAEGMQPLQQHADWGDITMRCAGESPNAGLPSSTMASEHSQSTVSPSASQQHGPSQTLPRAAESSGPEATTSSCKCCSRSMPRWSHVYDIKPAGPGEKQMVRKLGNQGSGRRRGRRSLSTREACAAFLANTASLQARAPESNSILCAKGLAPEQHREACQHIPSPSACSQVITSASIAGVGISQLPEIGDEV